MHLVFLRLLRKFKILKRINTSSKLSLNGHSFIIPIKQELGIHNLMMDEFWMMDIFKQLSLNENALLIDVGANVGQTLLKWKAIYKNGTYIGLEPIKACAEYLEVLIKENNFQDCKIIDQALAEKTGTAELNFHFEESGDRSASLYSDSFKAIKSEKIKTITFEDLLSSCGISKNKINVIKIDVEGAELEILRSLKDFLVNHQPIIIIEILNTQAQRINEINEIISSLPYHWYRIDKKNLNLKSLTQIDKIEGEPSIEESDYMLIPENAAFNSNTLL